MMGFVSGENVSGNEDSQGCKFPWVFSHLGTGGAWPRQGLTPSDSIDIEFIVQENADFSL